MNARSAAITWKIAYWILLICWIVGAILYMWRIPAGVFNSYLSDVTFPPWFYIVVRGLATDGRKPRLVRPFGRSPEIAAAVIFAVGVISEIGQRYGIISGTFDRWDFAAYGAGLCICVLCEK